jgi:hypothetical protein
VPIISETVALFFLVIVSLLMVLSEQQHSKF